MTRHQKAFANELYYIQILYSPIPGLQNVISMSQCKKDVTPWLPHWGLVFFPLTHWSVENNELNVTADNIGNSHWLIALPKWRKDSLSR